MIAASKHQTDESNEPFFRCPSSNGDGGSCNGILFIEDVVGVPGVHREVVQGFIDSQISPDTTSFEQLSSAGVAECMTTRGDEGEADAARARLVLMIRE